MARLEAVKEFKFLLGKEMLNFASRVINGMDPEQFAPHLLPRLIQVALSTIDQGLAPDTKMPAFGGDVTDIPETPDAREEWTDDQVNEALEYMKKVGLSLDLTGFPLDTQDSSPGDSES